MNKTLCKLRKPPKTTPAITKYHMPAVIEKDEDGFFAYCPILPGCCTQGDTYEEAVENIKDAMRLYIEDLLANGEEVPTGEIVSFSSLEVAV